MGKIIALRSLANHRLVCAEGAGAQPLIANRDEIGQWEMFEQIEVGAQSPDPPASPVPQPPQPPPIPTPSSPRAWTLLPLTHDEPVPAREYSYWPHACVIGDAVYAFCCSRDNHPPFFRIAGDGTITRMGPLIGYEAEGEGWYWNAYGQVYVIVGPQLHRLNPLNGDDEVIFDISDLYPNHVLWQAHSSDDDSVHCATVLQRVESGAYPKVATVIAHGSRTRYIAANGALDETHLTTDGQLVIVEQNNDNLIFDANTGQLVQLIKDADGALSHIDCGPTYMVGEDNINGRAWKIELPNLQRTELEQTWGMGHVSVQNGRCLLSNAGSLMWMDLNGGGLTHILDHGMVTMGGDPYDYQVKANLDRTATVCLYMTNHGGGPFQNVMLANLANTRAVKPRLHASIRSHHRRHPPRI